MAKVKKGDLVQVMTGKKQDRGGDRGKQGRVLAVNPETNRVIVEGINLVKKHTKVGSGERGAKTGGIETMESPIHISNVAVVDPSTNQPTRIGIRTEVVDRNGVKKTVRIRVAKKSGKDI
jgi:large subunit ribosomal protein L24